MLEPGSSLGFEVASAGEPIDLEIRVLPGRMPVPGQVRSIRYSLCRPPRPSTSASGHTASAVTAVATVAHGAPMMSPTKP